MGEEPNKVRLSPGVIKVEWEAGDTDFIASRTIEQESGRSNIVKTRLEACTTAEILAGKIYGRSLIPYRDIFDAAVAVLKEPQALGNALEKCERMGEIGQFSIERIPQYCQRIRKSGEWDENKEKHIHEAQCPEAWEDGPGAGGRCSPRVENAPEGIEKNRDEPGQGQMTTTKQRDPGEDARTRARGIVWKTCNERIARGLGVEGVQWTGDDTRKDWRLKPGAEEAAFIGVYSDEWFTHPQATRTKPRGDGKLLSLLAASGLAGAPPETRDRVRLRVELHEAKGDALRSSGWSQIVPGLRKDEWLELIADEGLSWRRAAEILRPVTLEFGGGDTTQNSALKGRVDLPVAGADRAPAESAMACRAHPAA